MCLYSINFDHETVLTTGNNVLYIDALPLAGWPDPPQIWWDKIKTGIILRER